MRLTINLLSKINKNFNNVRVRFAPSPTGNLHLGGLRTAFYNYLFAKHYDGQFILRIEDTDQTRLVEGCSEQFEKILNDFNLKPDESPLIQGNYGPYKQSQRLNFYDEYSNILIDSGKAYRCFCSTERLEILRKNALKKNETPKYDNRCRNISKEESNQRIKNGESYVVRFKFDKGEVNFKDLIYGSNTQTIDEGDFVIIKSDKYPTYHFANVVDDYLMNISHVIRGMEWLPSTPKHIRLYNAFEWNLPNFCHLPLIMKNNRQKLSKRDAAAYVGYYTTDKGYLPLAVLNYLLRNGSGISNFNNQKLYSLEELINDFNVDEITTKSLLMDETSLEMYGKLAFQNSNKNEILGYIINYINENITNIDTKLLNTEYINRVITFIGRNEESFSCLSELTKGDFKFFFGHPKTSEELIKKYEKDLCIQVFNKLIKMNELNLDKIKNLASKLNIKSPKLMAIIRYGLIGSFKGPPLTELFEFFSIDECKTRIMNMIEMLNKENVNKREFVEFQ